MFLKPPMGQFSGSKKAENAFKKLKNNFQQFHADTTRYLDVKIRPVAILSCLLAKEFFKVLVPVAVSPYNFFVQPFDSKDELHELMNRLQTRYKGVQYGGLKVDDVMPGNIYASEFKGYWYRTSVIKVINTGASVSVFYCDFGYYQTLSVKQLVPLDDEFMALPYQALKAKLAGIKPTNNKWTMQDCETFKDSVEHKILFSHLVNLEKDVLYESDLVLKLVLIDTNADEDVIIGQELVKRGIALEEK